MRPHKVFNEANNIRHEKTHVAATKAPHVLSTKRTNMSTAQLRSSAVTRTAQYRQIHTQRSVHQRERIIAAQLDNTTSFNNDVRIIQSAPVTMLRDNIDSPKDLRSSSGKLALETKDSFCSDGPDVSMGIV